MASIGDTTRPEYIYDQATDTWIPVGIGPHAHTPAAIGAIASSIVTTKGDIIAATGSGLVVRQGVGADGSMLVADSSQTDGLNYALGNAYAAGKNKIINGDFGVWQRGTSLSLTTNAGAYLPDRFLTNWAGTFTGTISQQTFTAGTAPVSGYEGTYFCRVNRTGTTSVAPTFYQRIENVRTLAGQTVTFSFWAKADTNRSVTLNYYQAFGSGGSGATTAGIGTAALTTSWQRFTFTFAMPSIAGKTVGTDSWTTVYFDLPDSTAFTFDIWGVQLEAGSVATPFQTATGNPASELAACQRYYWRWVAGSNQGNSQYARPVSTAHGQDGNTITFTMPFPVRMRQAPTALETGGTISAYYNSAFVTGGTLALDSASYDTVTINWIKTGAIAVNGCYQVMAQNSMTAYLGFSGEL